MVQGRFPTELRQPAQHSPEVQSRAASTETFPGPVCNSQDSQRGLQMGGLGCSLFEPSFPCLALTGWLTPLSEPEIPAWMTAETLRTSLSVPHQGAGGSGQPLALAIPPLLIILPPTSPRMCTGLPRNAYTE